VSDTSEWYPYYPRDFRAKTLHLSLAEEGAYKRLMDEYYMRKGPLPNNDAAIARLLGVSLDEWLAVAPAVRPFFRARGDLLHHKRCEEELAARELRYARRRRKAQMAAAARWQPDTRKGRVGDAPSNAPSMLRACSEHARSIHVGFSENDNKNTNIDATSNAASNAYAMLANATLNNNKITTSEYDAARGEGEGGESVGPAASPLESSLAGPPNDGGEGIQGKRGGQGTEIGAGALKWDKDNLPPTPTAKRTSGAPRGLQAPEEKNTGDEVTQSDLARLFDKMESRGRK